MDLNFIVALLTLVLIVCAASINASKIAKHQVEPTFSSWLIFLACTSTSFLSYLVSSHKSFVAGVLNGSDVIGDLIVIFSIVFFGITRWRLKSFEKYYLFGLIIISLFWLFTSDAFDSNLLIQLLLTLGYIPTMHGIIKSKRNTESFVVWGLILTASVVSIYPSFSAWEASKNILALVYSVRSVVLVGILMITMAMYRLKGKVKIPNISKP